MRFHRQHGSGPVDPAHVGGRDLHEIVEKGTPVSSPKDVLEAIRELLRPKPKLVPIPLPVKGPRRPRAS